MAEKVADLFAEIGANVNEAQWKRADAVIAKAKTAVGAFLGFFAIDKISDFIGSTVELGGRLADAEQQTGVSAETLQEYGYIAGLAGADTESFIEALGKLNKGLAEAAKTGKGPAADALRSIGISMNDPAVKAGNLDEILLEVADKFRAMPDGPKKVAAAMDLFGKSGARLIPTLNAGGEGIEALKKEARDLGIVMSKEDIGKLDQLGDDTDRLKGALGGLKNQLVLALAPAINSAVTGFTEWIKSNRETIKSVLSMIGAIATSKQFLIGMGVVLGAIAIKGALAFAAFLAPLLPVIAILAAIALVVYDVWKSIKTGKGVTASVFNWIRDKATWVADGVKVIGTAIQDFFTAAANAIKGVWNSVVGFVQDKIKATQKMLDDAKHAWDDFLDTDFGEANNPAGLLGGKRGEEQKARAKTEGAVAVASDRMDIMGQLPDWLGGVGSATLLGGGGGSGDVDNSVKADVNITVNAAPGMNERDVGKQTAAQIAASLRDVQSRNTGSGND